MPVIWILKKLSFNKYLNTYEGLCLIVLGVYTLAQLLTLSASLLANTNINYWSVCSFSSRGGNWGKDDG